ncbi:hypothetical protein HII36_21610 [Nonomuraea sp. NN258]|uniref:DUF5946 family protein n=1 Tax=Nonomuraea antri TaxID=2730852 RepID=UPI0015698075|nr:DUF5946 family protein [Nonomuraea antri]NRQ34430.1 hypothetical protein [Nonomuraea antri]
MIGTPETDRCECGASAGPLGVCVDYYHAVLAEEQGDPLMYRWHAPVVCAYLLQHPARAHQKYLDGQFRQLQLFLDLGLDAMLRLAAHQVTRNKRGGPGFDVAPLAAYAPLPPGGPPPRFRATFRDLPAGDGGFVSDGHPAYGRRIEAIAAATVESWLALR